LQGKNVKNLTATTEERKRSMHKLPFQRKARKMMAFKKHYLIKNFPCITHKNIIICEKD
jgi:5'(3')-deoxyribonucleotidase